MSGSHRKSNIKCRCFPWKNIRPRDEEHRYWPPLPFLRMKVPPPLPGGVSDFVKSIFGYELLAIATNGFSAANFLGQGDYASVYKGVLPNGKEVVIKKLKESIPAGREPRAEAESICSVRHKNLISMEGYCITGSHRLFVYEFLPNNSLKFHLHGKGQQTIDWPTRWKIACGIAKGLVYLHHDCDPKILHYNIKSSNIFLDSDFEAKVSDFGLAKSLFNYDHLSQVRDLPSYSGYIDSEYATTGKFTDKADVFSFGVVLLELITGHKPLDPHRSPQTLAEWAKPLITQAIEHKDFDALVDPRLQNDYDWREMTRMIGCAAVCVQSLASRRPPLSEVEFEFSFFIPYCFACWTASMEYA